MKTFKSTLNLIELTIFVIALFQQIFNLEQAMLSQDISIPVYFSKYDDQLNTIIEDLSKFKPSETVDEMAGAGKRDSALSEIINSISANGYQVRNIAYEYKIFFLKMTINWDLFNCGVRFMLAELIIHPINYRKYQ